MAPENLLGARETPLTSRHPRLDRGSTCMVCHWIPAFARMTMEGAGMRWRERECDGGGGKDDGGGGKDDEGGGNDDKGDGKNDGGNGVADGMP